MGVAGEGMVHRDREVVTPEFVECEFVFTVGSVSLLSRLLHRNFK